MEFGKFLLGWRSFSLLGIMVKHQANLEIAYPIQTSFMNFLACCFAFAIGFICASLIGHLNPIFTLAVTVFGLSIFLWVQYNNGNRFLSRHALLGK